jgi:hypothetical protein
MRKSGELGKLTEFSAMGLPGADALRLEGSFDDPRLLVCPAGRPYKGFTSDETMATLHNRDVKGGACPARQYVPLPRNGQTHNNVMKFSDTVYKRTGVVPPLLEEDEKGLYVDPVALVFSYVTYAVAQHISPSSL